MINPTARVLAVLELLQTHRRLSGTELAERLEVNGRTLRRYIALLQDLGIPITTERGRYGGYMLMTGYKLPPMMFTNDEALALTIGLLAARNLGFTEAAAAASALAKLERVMPENLKNSVRAIDETVTLAKPRAGKPGSNDDTLVTLTGAAQARQRVHVHYRSGQGSETERDFDPYGLAFWEGSWYVGGYCHLRGDLRSFRLDRIHGVRTLDVVFKRPEQFDAYAHLITSIATIHRTMAVEVLLRTGLQSAMEQLYEGMGLFEPCDGGVLFRAQVDDLDWFARQLARLSCTFEIREPAALRGAIHRHAEQLLESGSA